MAGLGPRGKEALFASRIEEKQEHDVLRSVPTAQLTACLAQPRKSFDEELLKELASSIQEKGIVQPLVVRKLPSAGLNKDIGGIKYEIVAGERRWRAAKMIHLPEVPIIIREYSDLEVMTIALVENIQRENLNPMEEAEAFALLKDKYNLSQEELAKSLGKSRPRVANALRLLNLPENIRLLILEGKISGAHGRTLLALRPTNLLEELIERILTHGLSVRDIENLVEYANTYNELPSLRVQKEEDSSIKNEETSEERAELIIEKEEKTLNLLPIDKKKRRLAKSDEFTNFQKQLRAKFHRGASISGSLENGKISFPFAGEAELKHLLHLLSLDSMLDIFSFNPDTQDLDTSISALSNTSDILST